MARRNRPQPASDSAPVDHHLSDAGFDLLLAIDRWENPPPAFSDSAAAPIITYVIKMLTSLQPLIDGKTALTALGF
jgi:hypothetical protein